MFFLATIGILLAVVFNGLDVTYKNLEFLVELKAGVLLNFCRLSYGSLVINWSQHPNSSFIITKILLS
jgi:hypothetical protein